jgi:endogenous inhibitor of DNA gyrase (YacG/DUF329 family)
MLVKCPTCGKEAEYFGNEFRPFCSERCKLIDLGAWVDGKYRIPDDEKISESEKPSETFSNKIEDLERLKGNER